MKLIQNPPAALGDNKKQAKRKRIFHETIVAIGNSELASLTKIACSHLLNRPFDSIGSCLLFAIINLANHMLASYIRHHMEHKI